MVEDLIRRARRRFLFNEALGQLAFAASIALAGLALLLIFGTRYLEWWTLAVFAAAGLGIGIARVWRGAPSEYATAVRLDEKVHLSDALSTALYFASRGASSRFQRAQREQAEEAVRRVDLNGAAPFTFPRAIYAMAAFTLLASGLVVLRYRITRGLDLRPPITEVLFEDLAAREQPKKQARFMDPSQRKRMEAAESLLAKLGIPLNPDQQPGDALDNAIEQALERPANGDQKGQKGDGAGKSENGKAGNGLEQSPDGDPMDGSQKEGAENSDQGKSPGAQDGAAGDKGSSKNGTAGDNSSLMSKLKDAVSNMLSKARQDSSPSGQKAQSQQQGGQMAKAQKSGEKGSAGKGEQQSDSQADAQEGEPNGDAQEGQQAQGKTGSKNSAQQASQAGSGVGSQDGAKDLKAAEQLKAMGKISEIIGKRAATVSGETTIEVQSGNQQLRTAYTNKAASHGEAESDVSRDEIPVALQPYVQQYFEQVRKSAGPKPKTP